MYTYDAYYAPNIEIIEVKVEEGFKYSNPILDETEID